MIFVLDICDFCFMVYASPYIQIWTGIVSPSSVFKSGPSPPSNWHMRIGWFKMSLFHFKELAFFPLCTTALNSTLIFFQNFLRSSSLNFRPWSKISHLAIFREPHVLGSWLTTHFSRKHHICIVLWYLFIHSTIVSGRKKVFSAKKNP